MAFKLVYYSQQDPQWKNDILGFGDPGDTIGYVGCALTSVAMLLSGHGYTETPKTLNQKLKNVDGFVSAGIRWGAVSQIYPKVTLKAFIPCSTSDAPLAQIDAATCGGSARDRPGGLFQRSGHPNALGRALWQKGDDYLMLDPWPYQPDITKEDLLMKRYAQGRSLKRAISHVILYEAYGSGGPIVTPAHPPRLQLSRPRLPFRQTNACARVKDSVTWGLNIRSSIDTSSMANVVATVPAGTVNSRCSNRTAPRRSARSTSGCASARRRDRKASPRRGIWKMSQGRLPLRQRNQPPVPRANRVEHPSPRLQTPTTHIDDHDRIQAKEDKLIVVVSSAVGTSGLRLRKTASKGGALVAVLKAGTRLTVLEPAKKAKAKIGKANQWLYVRGPE